MSATGRQDAPRYATLRDYVRVLKANRWLILLVAVVCAAAAYAITARQKPTYAATASIFFQDTSQELNILGTSVSPTLTDITRAQINAQMVTQAPVAIEAKKQLRSTDSPSALAASISTFVNSQTAVVDISAASAIPARAQQLANAFANATKIVDQRRTRAQFAATVASVKAQYAPLIASAPDPGTKEAYRSRIATLEVLAKTADPVQIVQLASLPRTPTGPRTVRNTILGLLLGLTLGLLVAFVRDALDRRLRGSAEIGEEVGWPVIGHVRKTALPAVFFRDGDKGTDEADRESFRMLRQNIRFLDVDNPPKTVVVSSALPEEGKSTVAAGLACASAAAGLRTLLVECDLRRPSLARRFDLQQTPGLTDFLLGDAKPADVLQTVELPIPRSLNGASAEPGETAPVVAVRRLACITAGRQAPETAELLVSTRFKTFLRDVSVVYDQVILDSSPLLSVADTTAVMTEVEAALICVRSGRTTRDEVGALKRAVARLPDVLIGVVVTGVRPGSEHDLGYYSYAYES